MTNYWKNKIYELLPTLKLERNYGNYTEIYDEIIYIMNITDLSNINFEILYYIIENIKLDIPELIYYFMNMILSINKKINISNYRTKLLITLIKYHKINTIKYLEYLYNIKTELKNIFESQDLDENVLEFLFKNYELTEILYDDELYELLIILSNNSIATIGKSNDTYKYLHQSVTNFKLSFNYMSNYLDETHFINLIKYNIKNTNHKILELILNSENVKLNKYDIAYYKTLVNEFDNNIMELLNSYNNS